MKSIYTRCLIYQAARVQGEPKFFFIPVEEKKSDLMEITRRGDSYSGLKSCTHATLLLSWENCYSIINASSERCGKAWFYDLHVHDLISFSDGCHFIMLFVNISQFFHEEKRVGILSNISPICARQLHIKHDFSSSVGIKNFFIQLKCIETLAGVHFKLISWLVSGTIVKALEILINQMTELSI